MHDIAGLGITIATILAATIFSNQSVNNLRSELNGLRIEFRSEISSIRAEMGGMRSEMHGIRTELLGRLDSIKRDMRDLYAEQARQDLRFANLEQHKN